MRIRATCTSCGREFLFLQLYTAEPGHNDRCPHCNEFLGVVHVRTLALAADRALTRLVDSLEQIAVRHPAFTIERDTVLRELEHVVDVLGPRSPTADEEPDERFLQRLRDRRAG
jgi:hypothetical protein